MSGFQNEISHYTWEREKLKIERKLKISPQPAAIL